MLPVSVSSVAVECIRLRFVFGLVTASGAAGWAFSVSRSGVPDCFADWSPLVAFCFASGTSRSRSPDILFPLCSFSSSSSSLLSRDRFLVCCCLLAVVSPSPPACSNDRFRCSLPRSSLSAPFAAKAAALASSCMPAMDAFLSCSRTGFSPASVSESGAGSVVGAISTSGSCQRFASAIGTFSGLIWSLCLW